MQASLIWCPRYLRPLPPGPRWPVAVVLAGKYKEETETWTNLNNRNRKKQQITGIHILHWSRVQRDEKKAIQRDLPRTRGWQPVKQTKPPEKWLNTPVSSVSARLLTVDWKKKRSKVLEFYQPYALRAKGWKRKYSPERKVAVAGSNSHCRRCFASVSRRGLAGRIAVAGEGCWLSSEEGDTAGKEAKREGGQPRLGFLPRCVREGDDLRRGARDFKSRFLCKFMDLYTLPPLVSY